MKNKENKKVGGLVFVGCMFIGAGLGYVFGNVQAGGALGMGVGFLAMAYLRFKS